MEFLDDLIWNFFRRDFWGFGEMLMGRLRIGADCAEVNGFGLDLGCRMGIFGIGEIFGN